MSKTTNEERLSVIETKLDNIMNAINEIKNDAKAHDEKFVHRDEHKELRRLVYWLMGICGTIGGTVVTYLILRGI